MIKTLEKFNSIWVVLGIWLIVNLLTAGLTELYADEAYYYLYGQNLSWGYFDHPPMIGLFSEIGFSLLQNELGVRFLGVIGVTLSLYYIYQLSTIQPIHFGLVIFSILALNLIGFQCIPDTPLFVFTVFFFVAYQRYLLKSNVLNSVLLALSIAAMMYSKYHGILTVGFTVLSNVALFKKKSFYVVALVAFMLFLPHIYWQISNDFPSLKYHLVDRNADGYSVMYTFSFIGENILFYGPFVFVLLFTAFFKGVTKNQFDRALLFNLIGFLMFFGIMTFKGRAEVNWTMQIMIPLMIVGGSYVSKHLVWRKWLYYLSGISGVLILALRIHTVHPFFFHPLDRTNELRGNRKMVQELVQKTKGIPMVANRYQDAGILSFYSQKMVPALNVHSRENQFTFWPHVDTLLGKEVCFISLDQMFNRSIDSVMNGFGKPLYVINYKALPVFRGATFEIENVEIYHDSLFFNLDYSFYPERILEENDSTWLRVNHYKNNEHIGGYQKRIKDLKHHERIGSSLAKEPDSYSVDILTPYMGVWNSSKIYKLP